MNSAVKSLSLIMISFLLVTMSLGAALSAGTPVVTPGSDPTAQHLAGLVYRELTTGKGSNFYLGIPDLNDSTHRTQLYFDWGASNAFSFTYDPVLDKLSTTVDNGSGEVTLEYPDFAANLRNLVFGGDQALTEQALNTLNYLQLNVRLGENTPAELHLQDVTLNGIPLGSFSGVTHKTSSWQVNGYDLSGGFTLAGNLQLVNITSPSPKLNNVEITFGRVDADIFAPAIADIVAAPNPASSSKAVTLTASVDDSSSGGSLIQAAEYSVDGTAWMDMNPVDGAYDSSTESVTALFTAPAGEGAHAICIQATDSANNTSQESCINLTVENQAPVVSGVIVDPQKTGVGTPVILSAQVDDSTTGGLGILSAEFTNNGVDWSPMTAVDGSFDSAMESVTAEFLSPNTSGSLEICARGTDAAGNTGAQECASLSVDNQGPLTSTPIVDPDPVDPGVQVTLTANLDDISTGNSILASAEYQLAGGSWLPMAAGDGSFDTSSEQVAAQFTAPNGSASIVVCVRGSDEHGNTGPEACQQLQINQVGSPPNVYLPFLVSNYGNP
jgi:hypothetical protein